MSLKSKISNALVTAAFVVVVATLTLLIYGSRPTPGAGVNQALYFFELLLVASFVLFFRFRLPSQVRNLAPTTRMIIYVLAAAFPAGYLIYIVHSHLFGIWVSIIAGVALGSFFLRIDLLIKTVMAESLQDQKRRIMYGGAGFIVMFSLGLLSNTGLSSVSAWLAPLIVMSVIIGVMTIRSRMAIAYDLIPAGAKERDLRILADFYEKTEANYIEDQRYRIASVEYAVQADELKRSLGKYVYFALYILLTIAAGLFTTGYYVYSFARSSKTAI